MSPLILTPAQSEAIRDASLSIPVLDSAGKMVGTLIPEPVDSEEMVLVDQETLELLAERMAQKDLRWYTTDEVLERLRLLEEQLNAQ